MKTQYDVRKLTEEQFALIEDDWQNCLQESLADAVFSSWAWCYSWWKTWSENNSFRLHIIVVMQADTIVAIAPLYLAQVHRKYGPKGGQLQFIGSAWRITGTVRSEYTNFIIRKGHESEIQSIFKQQLQQSQAQDLIVKDHSPLILSGINTLGNKLTIRDTDYGVSLNVNGQFQDWVKSIGKNTRLKVFNRRTYLQDRVELSEVAFSDENDRNSFFRQLCEFHQGRRQQQPSEEELNFHFLLAANSGKYVKPVYSVLKVDNKIVSLLYDIQAGDRRYNLQCVFIEDFDKKVSLGLLHLGYAVEQAFNDPLIEVYDFLAGAGKNTYYKEKLIGDCGSKYKLVTSQLSLTHSHTLYISFNMFVRKLLKKPESEAHEETSEG